MSYYTSAITLAGSCFWCERPFAREFGPKAITRDHLIPQWACRLFYVQLGHASRKQNIVIACTSCNAAKGGMPPEAFHRTRHLVGGERKRLSTYWHNVQNYVCASWSTERGIVDPELKAYIIEEMLKPIPGHEPKPDKDPVKYYAVPMTDADVALLNKPNKRQRRAFSQSGNVIYASGLVPQAKVIGPPGEPFSKNKPLQRLYSLEDHEKLNSNLGGVR